MSSRSLTARPGVTLAVVTLLGCCLGSCQRLPPSPQPPSLVFEPMAPAGDGLVPVDVCIDDSRSMEGFTRPPESRYKSVVSKLLQKLTTARYDHHLGPFSDPTCRAQMGAASPPNLLAPDFYQAKETPLATVFSRLPSRLRDGRMVVVISDFVQSELARSQDEFVGGLVQASTTGSDALLLGFRSAFQGPYFVERERRPGQQVRLNLNLDGAAFARSRPFYMFVCAPSHASLSRFRNDVVDHLKPDEELAASDRPFEVTKAEFAASRHLISVRDPLAAGPRPTIFAGSFVEPKASTADTVEVKLQLTGVHRLGLRSLEQLDYEAERLDKTVSATTLDAKALRWTALELAAKASIPGTAAPQAASSFVVSYQLPRVGARGWDLYRVRIRSGRGNVALPKWITEWSTDDDRVLARGHRTLHLEIIGEALIRAVTERTVITEHYLLVRTPS